MLCAFCVPNVPLSIAPWSQGPWLVLNVLPLGCLHSIILILEIRVTQLSQLSQCTFWIYLEACKLNLHCVIQIIKPTNFAGQIWQVRDARDGYEFSFTA